MWFFFFGGVFSYYWFLGWFFFFQDGHPAPHATQNRVLFSLGFFLEGVCIEGSKVDGRRKYV